MADTPIDVLSRRERQIMDIVYRLGRATAADVLDNLGDPPSYSAVRALLRVLEDKGHLRHEIEGPRYVYLAMVPLDAARESALTAMVRTFFDGSASQAVAALLGQSASTLSDEELERLAQLVEKAKTEGR
ncbi:MAG: BlaI/MecI/CopY family transcriptional regulator [Gemmatimonadota bacterium]|nr:BlaI/MecI/CopY family transcriptional regulator [Gemmatimonadota bacterium]